MTMLRSAMIAGVGALGCVGMLAQPADAQMRGGGFGGFNGGHGGFNHPGFGHPGFGGNRFFFGFGFPGFGFGGYPYYPYYPAYYPPYPAYYPPYPAYSGYPAAASTVYPGYPAYSAHPVTASPGATRAVDPTTVLVQAELQRQGYDVGPIDGLLGPRTRTAIREYEQRDGLPLDELPSRSLLDHMRAHPTG